MGLTLMEIYPICFPIAPLRRTNAAWWRGLRNSSRDSVSCRRRLAPRQSPDSNATANPSSPPPSPARLTQATERGISRMSELPQGWSRTSLRIRLLNRIREDTSNVQVQRGRIPGSWCARMGSSGSIQNIATRRKQSGPMSGAPTAVKST